VRCRDWGYKADENLVWNDTVQRPETGPLRFKTNRKYLHIHLCGNDVRNLLEYYRKYEGESFLKALGTTVTYLGILPA